MAKHSFSEVRVLALRLRDELTKQMPTLTLLGSFIAPQRIVHNPAFKNDGTRKDKRIIKNVAGLCLRTFQSGMMNGNTPKTRPWYNLTVLDESRNNRDSVRKFFSKRQATMNNYFQVSNLYQVLPLAYKDVGAFSNAAFAQLPHPKYGSYFYPFAIGTYSFSTDAEGNPNMFTRDFSMTVRQVVEQYAQKNDAGQIIWSNIPGQVKQFWDAARYTEVINLRMLIVPNPDYHPVVARYSLDPSDKKYCSYTWYEGGAGNIPPQSSNGFRNESGGNTLGENQFIKVSGFDYFPVIIPRWEVQAEEDFGVDGPGHLALSDVMTVQTMEMSRLEAIAKLLKPPMVGHSSMRRHMASILAGGITYVDDAGAQAGFKPAFQIDPKIAELIMNQDEYTDLIKRAFFEDLFLMLAGDETKTHVTAREIDEKASEKMAALAPATSQLDRDLNSKLITNQQIILEAQGRLEKRPKELEGEEFIPQYISILAQAAKVSRMNSVERSVNFATSMAQAMNNPTLLKIFDDEAIVRGYADYTAMDPIFIRGEDDFNAIKQGVQRQQAQQQQAAMMQQQAATAKDLGATPVGEGSLLDTLSNAAQA